MALDFDVMQENSVSQDFGYLFVPFPHPGLHGHQRLEVRLQATPTHEHFDPEQVSLTVKLPSGSGELQLDEIVLFHPWTGGEIFEFCAGHIFVSDRKGKKVDAFTFEGEAHIHTKGQITMVVFESPAPIFEVTPLNPVIDLFVDEVEILLAIRRAEWLQVSSHLNSYEERLCLAEPMHLYQACLQGVEERLTRVYEGGSEALFRLRSAIRAEFHWLKTSGAWLGERSGVREMV